MKRLITAISTLVQVYKPSTLDADYIKISFKCCNELAKVPVGFASICLRKSVLLSLPAWAHHKSNAGSSDILQDLQVRTIVRLYALILAWIIQSQHTLKSILRANLFV